MPRISDILRRQVFERARGLCEYCQTPQAIVVEMEVDPIIPVAVGGSSTLENLCLACISCNAAKVDFQYAIDPATGGEVALFNPRPQHWKEHFRWSADGVFVVGITSTGRATVERLRMNRSRVAQARRIWVEAGWHPPH